MAEDFPEGLESVESRKERHELILSTLAKYEMLETLSLLEMLLWSMKIKEVTNTTEVIPERPGQEEIDNYNYNYSDIERQGFLINCEAEIVISNVLTFLSW